MPKVQRFFLEIKKIKKPSQTFTLPENVKISLKTDKNININKIFLSACRKRSFLER